VTPGVSRRGPTDPRSLLAIERTLLSWLRTGLALITFGFLVARIGVWLRGQGTGMELQGSRLMGALFAALGMAANLLAVARYLRFRRAVLTGTVVPTSPLPLLGFASIVTIIGAALSVIVLAQLF
jgi:putative membrane protein